jgi:hypothetical protein
VHEKILNRRHGALVASRDTRGCHERPSAAEAPAPPPQQPQHQEARDCEEDGKRLATVIMEHACTRAVSLLRIWYRTLVQFCEEEGVDESVKVLCQVGPVRITELSQAVFSNFLLTPELDFCSMFFLHKP